MLHSQYRRAAWPDRMAVNLPDLLSNVCVSFPSSVLTYQAAAEGVGVAVGKCFY
jgi:LysR family glycine cleavage system transcriptional activator